MFGTRFGRQRSESRTNTRRRQLLPRMEGLESRELLSATPVNGGQWTYGSRITYSFVPDGTSIGGVSSNMFSTLNSSVGSNWQASIQKAAALWEAVANINLAQVSDNGMAFGASGNQQGDSNVGDIRFSMIPQSGSTIAFAMLPPPINGGTDAGDIVFNSNVTFGSGGYDLTTVALHEFGHALGMDHSSTMSDVMYAYYNGTNQSVSSDDASGIDTLYGAYPSDSVSNSTSATATPITLNSNGTATLPIESLAGPTDVDWFSVYAPSGTTGTLTVTMQTSNLSSAAPRVVIYASNGTTGLAQGTAPNVFGTTVTATTSVTAGTKYYIKALPASVTGAYGNYGLLLTFTSSTPTPVTPPSTTVAAQPDVGGGSLSEQGSNDPTLLQRVATDLNAAIRSLQTNGSVSTSLILSAVPDFAKLYSNLSSNLGGNSTLVADAYTLVGAYLSGQPAAELAASQNFLNNIVQIGGMTIFGDHLTSIESRSPQMPVMIPSNIQWSGNLNDLKVDYTPTGATANSGSDSPFVILTPSDNSGSSPLFGETTNKASHRNS